MTPIIVFDSSALISLSEKCFFGLLERIQSHTNARLLISQAVWNETVTVPEQIKRFELNAERIKQAVENEWLEIVSATTQTRELQKQIDDWSNHSFFCGAKPLKILQEGEIETMALFLAYRADAIAIDERTARMLMEEPLRLQNYISLQHDQPIAKNQANLNQIQKKFQKAVIVRSSDLLAWAYRHELFKFELNQTPHCLEAALYAVKYSGCSVSEREIEAVIQQTRKKT